MFACCYLWAGWSWWQAASAVVPAWQTYSSSRQLPHFLASSNMWAKQNNVSIWLTSHDGFQSISSEGFSHPKKMGSHWVFAVTHTHPHPQSVGVKCEKDACQGAFRSRAVNGNCMLGMEAWECSCCLCPFVPLTFWDFMWVWWHILLKPAGPSHGFQCMLPEKDNSSETWLQWNREQALMCTGRIKLCLGSPSCLHWKWRQREKHISPLPLLPSLPASDCCCHCWLLPSWVSHGMCEAHTDKHVSTACICTTALLFAQKHTASGLHFCSINKNQLQTT